MKCLLSRRAATAVVPLPMRIQYHLALLRCELDQELDELQAASGPREFFVRPFGNQMPRDLWGWRHGSTCFYIHGPYALLKDVVSNGSADLVGFYEPSNRLI